MAALRRSTFSSSPPHSGFHWAMILPAIQVAKPSFSQMSSHHCIVTRSPNQRCAFSCAAVLA